MHWDYLFSAVEQKSPRTPFTTLMPSGLGPWMFSLDKEGPCRLGLDLRAQSGGRVGWKTFMDSQLIVTSALFVVTSLSDSLPGCLLLVSHSHRQCCRGCCGFCANKAASWRETADAPLTLPPSLPFLLPFFYPSFYKVVFYYVIFYKI
uniref:Uncharacterized protein n=1 Tax=Pseudonaja textilis TaxID=8673 RepID=A0A670YVB4_PSETE